MTYPTAYAHLTAQRAYARAVARGGVPALVAPYRGFQPRPVTVPAQRRRSVQRERISA